MAFSLSPAVSVTELDLTTIVPNVSASVAGYAGDFEWGPQEQTVSISSIAELESIFGRPRIVTKGNSFVNQQDWFAVSNFLDYGNNIKVVRSCVMELDEEGVSTGIPAIKNASDGIRLARTWQSKSFFNPAVFSPTNYDVKFEGRVSGTNAIGVKQAAHVTATVAAVADRDYAGLVGGGATQGKRAYSELTITSVTDLNEDTTNFSWAAADVDQTEKWIINVQKGGLPTSGVVKLTQQYYVGGVLKRDSVSVACAKGDTALEVADRLRTYLNSLDDNTTLFNKFGHYFKENRTDDFEVCPDAPTGGPGRATLTVKKMHQLYSTQNMGFIGIDTIRGIVGKTAFDVTASTAMTITNSVIDFDGLGVVAQKADTMIKRFDLADGNYRYVLIAKGLTNKLKSISNQILHMLQNSTSIYNGSDAASDGAKAPFYTQSPANGVTGTAKIKFWYSRADATPAADVWNRIYKSGGVPAIAPDSSYGILSLEGSHAVTGGAAAAGVNAAGNRFQALAVTDSLGDTTYVHIPGGSDVSALLSYIKGLSIAHSAGKFWNITTSKTANTLVLTAPVQDESVALPTFVFNGTLNTSNLNNNTVNGASDISVAAAQTVEGIPPNSAYMKIGTINGQGVEIYLDEGDGPRQLANKFYSALPASTGLGLPIQTRATRDLGEDNDVPSIVNVEYDAVEDTAFTWPSVDRVLKRYGVTITIQPSLDEAAHWDTSTWNKLVRADMDTSNVADAARLKAQLNFAGNTIPDASRWLRIVEYNDNGTLRRDARVRLQSIEVINADGVEYDPLDEATNVAPLRTTITISNITWNGGTKQSVPFGRTPNEARAITPPEDSRCYLMTDYADSFKNDAEFASIGENLEAGFIYAIYGGKMGNNIGVAITDHLWKQDNALRAAMWDNAVMSPGVKWKDAGFQRPKTTQWAANNGAGAYDEMHVAVIDRTGVLTGAKGTILEKFVGVSKNKGNKDWDGSSNYYVDVINHRSNWIRIREGFDAAYGTFVIPAGDSDIPADALDWGTLVTTQDHDGTMFRCLNGSLWSPLKGGAVAQSSSADLMRAYDLLGDPEQVDVSLMLTGDHPKEVKQYIVDLTRSRMDAIAFVSPDQDSAVNNPTADKIIDYFNNDEDGFVSTSYAVFDSGYKLMLDKYNNVNFWAPLSTDIAGLCAQVDQNQEAWFSPAGYNRGFIKNCRRLSFNPNKAQRDLLFPVRINPVTTQSGEGTVLLGDKTAQSKPSAFDHINVRRVFSIMEKAIATASKYKLFEFNDPFTRASFVGMLNPYLRDIKARRGIEDFMVVCDETNNTAQVINSNRFVADIYIRPLYSINYIQLNFIAVPNGIEFMEVITNSAAFGTTNVG